LLAGCTAALSACNSAPSGIATPQLDPAAAAERAMADYDANGDKKLSADELKKSPGLAAAVKRFDENGDGSIAADELASRLREFQQQDAALVAVTCVVLHRNQPLQGAKVEFIPEPFLGDAIKPASGVTGADGTTTPTVADELLPEEYRGRIQGVNCGVYRVVVTHPQVAIPAKYNTATELGRIVTRRDHETLTIRL
jgi:hypothetical protein